MLLITLPYWVSFTMNFTIVIPLICFLYKLLQRERNYGRDMILILNISYLGHPLFNIFLRVFMLLEYEQAVDIAMYLMNTCGYFAIFWSVALALFTYQVLTSKKLFHFLTFMIMALCSCALMVGIFLYL